MSMKKLALALFAVLALGAFAANSAMASNEFKTTQGYWYTGTSPGTKLPFGAANAKPLTVEPNGVQTLETNVGGTALKLEAKKVKCSGCVIDNTEAAVAGTAKDVATIDGILVYEEVKVVEPTSCSTNSTITTKELTAEVGMNTANNLPTIEFFPKAGTATAFATVELTGASCPISGLSKITGTAFAQPVNATNIFAATQEIKTSKALQESAGTATSLKYGEKAAFLNGALKGSIGGTLFAVEES